MEGIKEVLGLWIEQTEGAKFWLKVMTELINRGLIDLLITVVDGLKGFPEAISSVFPEAQVQTCIVHLVRHSRKFAPWKERKLVAADLRAIYRAETVEMAEARLTDSEEKWDAKASYQNGYHNDLFTLRTPFICPTMLLVKSFDS